MPKPVVPDVPVIPTVPKPAPKPEPKPDPKPVPDPVPVAVCKRAGECTTPFAKDSKEEVLRDRGQQSQATLDAIIAASPPPADKALVSIEGRYVNEIDDDDFPFLVKGDQNFFETIPGAPKKNDKSWQRQEVTIEGLKGPNGESNPMVLETYGSKDMQTMLISSSRNRELDPNPSLRWSEMVMKHWDTFTGGNVRDLRFMVRNNIDTDRAGPKMDTRSATDLAVTRAGQNGADTTTVQTFRRVSEGEEKINYQLIAGTPHGDRVLKMLGDYHGRMGNLNIAAFHVYTPGMKNGPNGGREYAIIIEFGH